MKGTLHKCLEKMVLERYGKQVWKRVLVKTHLPATHYFDIRSNIDESLWEDLLKNTSEVLNKNHELVLQEYSDYWVENYTQRIYNSFYLSSVSTKEFITKLDFIHVAMTRNIEGAKPPRFAYNWISDNVLEIEYQSGRSMIYLFKSYLKSIDKHFKCKTKVEDISKTILRLSF